jgi:hypothetical protein
MSRSSSAFAQAQRDAMESRRLTTHQKLWAIALALEWFGSHGTAEQYLRRTRRQRNRMIAVMRERGYEPWPWASE